MLAIGLWYNWQAVLEGRDPRRRVVLLHTISKALRIMGAIADVLNRRWGNETIYVVHCRDQAGVRFPSGMDRQDELLLFIKQHVPERLLTVDKESRQDKASSFRQGFSLVWSFAAIIAGTIEMISLLPQLLSGDLRNAAWMAHAMLFLLVGIFLAAMTILRVKSVRSTAHGLLVKTWLSEFEVTWQDIKSVRRFPFDKSMVVGSRPGWFILGEELSRFDDLIQLVHNSTKPIITDDK
ncbi:unnamed protein product [Sphagnum balticum]